MAAIKSKELNFNSGKTDESHHRYPKSEISFTMLQRLFRWVFYSMALEPTKAHSGQIFHACAMKSRLVDFVRSKILNGMTENSKSVAVALMYGFFSTSMNFLNKIVVSSYEFNFPFFIMMIQMMFSVITIDTLRYFGFINLPPYSWKDGKELMGASICFALHSTLSLSALHGMNIPMYGAIKRCTPLVSLVLSVLVLKKTYPSKYIIISIFIITFGCLVAGLGDLQFERNAYLMGTLSVLAQGGYLTLVQKSAENQKSTLEMIHVNGYNTLPFFILSSLVTNEPSLIVGMKGIDEMGFYVAFCSVIFWGSLLTFSQFLCASVCSALTASLVLVGKSVIQTTVGFVTFGGVQYHPLNILGIVLNCLGGFLYTHVKYTEGKNKKKFSKVNLNGKVHSDVELNSHDTDPSKPLLLNDSNDEFNSRNRNHEKLFEEHGLEEQLQSKSCDQFSLEIETNDDFSANETHKL